MPDDGSERRATGRPVSTDAAEIGPEAFAGLSHRERERLRERRRRMALWGAEGPSGLIVVLLRDRAHATLNRARVFLGLLFATVVLGLAYFVGVPLWLEYQARLLDAERAREEAEITIEQGALADRLDELRTGAAARVPLTWSLQASGVTEGLWAVHFTKASTGWTVGDGGRILRTDDSGATWSTQGSDTEKRLQDVYFADTRTGWAVGDGSTILATDDGGANWTQRESGTDRDLHGVHFADARIGWVVGYGGTVLATDDGGVTWNGREARSAEYRSVFFLNSQTGWRVSFDCDRLPVSPGPIVTVRLNTQSILVSNGQKTPWVKPP